ncbi:hypothetical protein [uncultured Mediterranean phage]|nr:hypothetical protein [uncultured Mediterranean phage]
MIKTIQQLKAVNKKWFTPENKRFFNDINYKVLMGGKSKTRFLIQHTYQFSDMFDGIKKAVFVVKPISIEGKILPTVETLKELNQVKQYLKGV